MATNKLTNPPRDAVDSNRKDDAKNSYPGSLKNYRIGTYEYPDGLRIDSDKQHYIVFKVLVREKSKLGQNLRASGSLLDPSVAAGENKQVFGGLSQQAYTAGSNNLGETLGVAVGAGVLIGQTYNGVKSALAGDLSGTSKVPFSGKIKNMAKGTLKTLAKGALAGGAAYVVGEAVESFSDGFNYSSVARCKDVITLHIEESPTVKYGTNYTAKDLGTIVGAVFTASSMAGGLTDNMGTVGTAIGRTLAGVAQLPAIAGGGSGTDILSAVTRTKTNPFREVLFESTDYRDFTFRYKFFPKSKSETEKVKSIIEQFKVHMHPSIPENKLFFIYPSEFEIEYYYKNKKNDYLNAIARCVLTDMQIDYGGAQFSTFVNGAPVEIGLTLKFTELEQMTQEGIQKYGY